MSKASAVLIMGLGTKILSTEIEFWTFEYYCNLNEKLHGQRIRLKSLWTNEAVASMYIFYDIDQKQYMFKDFSSGYSGTYITLVQNLFNIETINECIKKINEDYKTYLLTNKKCETVLVEPAKYYVNAFKKRKWHKNDAKYWLEYQIGSSLLEKYNVYPLDEFSLAKENKNSIETIKFKNELMYGYFKSNGVLAKIYRPKCASLKFIKVSNYIQGSEQLEYKAPKLILASSMKDLLTLRRLKFNVEIIAPDSESTLISKNVMSSYFHKYKEVIAFFDNDDAGHRYMSKYKDVYGIEGIYLNMEKDLARSVKIHGLKKVRQYLKPLITA